MTSLVSSLLLLPFVLAWTSRIDHEEFLQHLPLVFALVAVFAVFGIGYSALASLRLHAQRLVPQYIMAPLVHLNILFVVVVSVAALGEERSVGEALGIALAFLPLILMQKRGADTARDRSRVLHGVLLVVVSSATAAGLQILTKVLVDPQFGFGLPPFVLVFGSSVGATLVCGILRTANRSPLRLDGAVLALSSLRGVFNVLSFVSLAVLLTTWDASTVYPLSALSLLIPVLWSIGSGADQRPTPVQWVAFGLALVAIALLV